MKKQERTIGLVMAVIMSIAMGIVAAVVIYNDPKAQTPPFPIFCLINLVESIIVGLLVALFVPLGKMGQALCKKAKAMPPSLKFNLLNSIPLALGNSLIVSTVVSFINVAQAHAKIPAEQAPPLFAMWFGSWAPLLLPSIVISYVLAILVSPIVVKMVMKPKH
ncbi:MAG: hypothetical protein E7295_13655 [Lachnospiraceae bacterium]|jgi:hypothetical protein|nr:hypothetical protein [Lachnospiraceae bacterium]